MQRDIDNGGDGENAPSPVACRSSETATTIRSARLTTRSGWQGCVQTVIGVSYPGRHGLKVCHALATIPIVAANVQYKDSISEK
jgi:hypothetical protein